jgi:hypothetical protein
LFLIDEGLRGPSFTLSRELLETALTFEFVIKRTVRLREFHDGKLRPVNRHGKSLTRLFKTELYHAHKAWRDLKYINELPSPRTAGIKKSDIDQLEKNIQAWESRIGSSWMKQLRKSTTCAGVTVRALAASLGVDRSNWYSVFYSLLSASTHAGDALNYAVFDEDGALCVTLDEDDIPAELIFSPMSALLMGMAGQWLRELIDADKLKTKLVQAYEEFDVLQDETGKTNANNY